MKIESQVCSLDLARKLKELKVKQDSLFYWSKLSIQTEYKLELRKHMKTQELVFADCSDYISSFTVAELINMLLEIFGHDIIIPNNVVVPNFLAEKIIGFYETCSKKD